MSTTTIDFGKWAWTCGGCGVRGRLFGTYDDARSNWEWHLEWCDADWAYVIISEEKNTAQTSGGVVY